MSQLLNKTVLDDCFSNFICSNNAPTVAEFIELRALVGWGEASYTITNNSLKSSLFHITIRDKNNLLAMGRVIGDGGLNYYIQDVVVHPQAQGLGLGDKVMQAIEAYLKDVAQPGATIGLFAAMAKETFYQRYGYIERPNQNMGKGMCRSV